MSDSEKGGFLEFSCHKIGEGAAEGEAMISSDDICFYLAEPESGVIIEKNHALEGQSVSGKILIFPSGKGSSIVQGDGLYMLNKHKKSPHAMIIEHADTVLVSGAIIMEIPLVDQVEKGFYEQVQNGDFVKVDADHGVITLIKK